jgi:hypothetical protein
LLDSGNPFPAGVRKITHRTIMIPDTFGAAKNLAVMSCNAAVNDAMGRGIAS